MSLIRVERNKNLEPWKRAALVTAIAAADAAALATPGYPRALKPVQVAQFLLESNWGKADMGAFNYFGIKAREGEPFVAKTTHEVIKGKTIEIVAKFRAYKSMDECFSDHAKLLTSRKRASGALIYATALSTPNDPVAFARALTGIYATDPAYGDKLETIMKGRGLLETFGFAA